MDKEFGLGITIMTRAKMSKHRNIKSNDFVFVSGLHALFQNELRSLYSVSIYLDIDENLRRYFKTKRDVVSIAWKIPI